MLPRFLSVMALTLDLNLLRYYAALPLLSSALCAQRGCQSAACPF